MRSKKLVELTKKALSDLKAQEITVVDVHRLTTITDFMVIASGSSSRHVRSIADHVIELAKQKGHEPLGVEGHEHGTWVLVDLADVVVHIMQPGTRDFYKLESLWSVGEESATQSASGQW